MKGSGRFIVSPSRVTWYSCMASSSADWVRGEARLISSARIRLAKIGPSRSTNWFCARLKMYPPVISPGSRSGVNWMRLNSMPRVGAKLLAISVLASPG